MLKIRESKSLLDHEKATPEFRKKMEMFVECLTKSCWLMTISNPTVVLNFYVVGQKFDAIKDRFVSFSTQEIVEATDDAPVGYVRLVAWPCLQLENESYLTKGEVVVVSDTNIN